MDVISIVVPCYNEEDALPVYYAEMKRVMAQMREVRFELIFVDDGSRDGTLELMRALHEADARCRYLSFSRNFGKEAAIYAGLSQAAGDYAAVMDADLQDPPSLLPQMYRIVSQETFDCAAARRVTRDGEPRLRSFLANRFYRCMGRLSGMEFVSGARDFRLMNRKMTDAVLELGEYNRFSKGMFAWVGFRTKWLEYENVERAAGKTKWSLAHLFRYAAEGIAGFSTAPLSLPALLGAGFCLGALLVFLAGLGGFLSTKLFMAGNWTLVCLLLLTGGIQLLCSGISSWYLSKVYLEVKRRPIYILQETSMGRETEKEEAAAMTKAGAVKYGAEEETANQGSKKETANYGIKEGAANYGAMLVENTGCRTTA